MASHPIRRILKKVTESVNSGGDILLPYNVDTVLRSNKPLPFKHYLTIFRASLPKQKKTIPPSFQEHESYHLTPALPHTPVRNKKNLYKQPLHKAYYHFPLNMKNLMCLVAEADLDTEESFLHKY